MTINAKTHSAILGLFVLGLAVTATAGMYAPAAERAHEGREARNEQQSHQSQPQPQPQTQSQSQSQPQPQPQAPPPQQSRGQRDRPAAPPSGGHESRDARIPRNEGGSRSEGGSRREGGNFEARRIDGSGRSGWNGRSDGDSRSYRSPSGQYRAPVVRVPRYVDSLPQGYSRHDWHGTPYYHRGGAWYRPYGNRYALVGAPYGLFVSYLPGLYSSFWFGSSRYYYADDTYYTYEPERRGYIVTRSPYNDDGDDADSSSSDDDLFIYPARGQSQQQQDQDRYECHRWAVDESHFDPIDGQYERKGRADYDRAITACLTGRGYSVR